MQVATTKKQWVIIMLMVLVLAFFVISNFGSHNQIPQNNTILEQDSKNKILVENNTETVKNSGETVENSSEKFANNSKKDTFEKTIQQNFDALISISSEKVFSGNSSSSFLGQGIILDKNGNILTNRHVVQNIGNSLYITYHQKKYPIENVWRDENYDLAILKTFDPIPEFIAPKIQESLQNEDFSGAISVWKITPEQLVSGQAKLLSGNYQTDIPGKPGDSGSILVNAKGEIIGINTAIDRLQHNYLSAIALDKTLILEAFESINTYKKLKLKIKN